MKQFIEEFRWLVQYAKPHWKVLMFVTLGGMCLSLFGLLMVLSSKYLIDTATGAVEGNIGLGVLALGSVILLQLVLQTLDSLVNVRTLAVVKNNIRARLLERVMNTEWMSLSRYHSGDMLMRMTSDIDHISQGITGIVPGLFALGVQLGGALVLLYVFDPIMAYAAILLGPVLMLFFKLFAKKLKELYLSTHESDSRVRAFVQEVIQQIQVVKTFNLEDRYLNKLKGLQREHLQWIMRKNMYSIFSGTAMGLSYWLTYFFALVWGSYRLADGMLTFGTLTAFLQLIGRVQGPFQGLVSTIPTIISTSASTRRAMDIYSLPQDDSDLEDSDLNSRQWNKSEKNISAAVQLDNVSFYYEQDKEILKDINLRVSPGEMVALVGTSGEGKTTLLKLMIALIKPSSGRVSISLGDRNDFDVGGSTRQFFTYVPQGNTVFSGTIHENLLLGDPDATREEVISCAKMASAWEFISKLPQGLETVVGENGIGLSEGQAQRLAIARALLRKAPVLLLDEATSALDEETEAQILQAIKEGSKKRTCIFVTHRTSVASCCDSIYTVAEGCLWRANEDKIAVF